MKSISQDILSQNFDVIQSDIIIYGSALEQMMSDWGAG